MQVGILAIGQDHIALFSTADVVVFTALIMSCGHVSPFCHVNLCIEGRQF
jgi:hypothetical protein